MTTGSAGDVHRGSLFLSLLRIPLAEAAGANCSSAETAGANSAREWRLACRHMNHKLRDARELGTLCAPSISPLAKLTHRRT